MGINYILLVVCLKLCSASSDLDKSNPNSTESDGHIAAFENHIHEHYGKVLGSIPESSREEGMHFVTLIFEAFGKEKEMSTDSLKKLFTDIGIGLDGVSHNDGYHTSKSHVPRRLDSEYHKHGLDETHHNSRHKRAPYKSHLHKNHMRCLSIHDMFHVYHFQNENRLTTEQFLHLCPAVIYQLNNRKCKVSGRSDHVQMEDDTSASETIGFSGVSAAVWGYSTLAVVIISLVGLLGVAVIPIMQKVFYNHLLQFLVALAVGALTGDALLHLLPHAIAGESLHHDDHGHHEAHKTAMLKGLCGLGGFFFFFLTERLVTIFASFKKKRKQERRTTKSNRDASACKDDGYTAQKLATCTRCKCQSGEERIGTDCTHLKVFDTNDSSCPETKHSHSKPHIAEEEGFLSPSHSHSGHLHSHGDILTNSVSSVAWMVILGDGIHNLSDGLAIGAAFADNITGGFSTAIAVFCHELPHEIGDFAVLLRAGMSVKQAVVYNILSSVLCFIGMLIGVAIGNIDEASQWIFAAIAGIFIYIALVDMLPEMTSGTQEDGYLLCHLLLHCLGMTTGASIMLIIAFYEEHLLTILGN